MRIESETDVGKGDSLGEERSNDELKKKKKKKKKGNREKSNSNPCLKMGVK